LVIVDDRQIRNVPNGLHRSTQSEAQSAYDSQFVTYDSLNIVCHLHEPLKLIDRLDV
jgi:hypothetical protein